MGVFCVEFKVGVIVSTRYIIFGYQNASSFILCVYVQTPI